MLNITQSEVKIAKLTPRLDDSGEGAVMGADVRLVFKAAEEATDTLSHLRLPTFSKALWDQNGAPTADGLILRTKTKIKNCDLTLWPTGMEDDSLVLTGDISNVKIGALPGKALEIDLKFRAEMKSGVFAKLMDLQAHGWKVDVGAAVRGSMQENQPDIHSVAGGE